MIRAVLFDIDNVLYNSSHQVEMARRAAIEAMVNAGLGMTLEEGFAKLEEIVKEYGSNFNKHYDMLAGSGPNHYKIVAAGMVAYHNTKRAYVKPYDDIIPTINKLKDSGYKIGVISNGLAVKQWEKLVRLGMAGMFDAVVVSEELGVSKPDPKIFEKACEEIGVDCESCIYVGDRLDSDILGANKVGMVSVRLLRGKYKEETPKGLQERPDFEIKRMEELLEILKAV